MSDEPERLGGPDEPDGRAVAGFVLTMLRGLARAPRARAFVPGILAALLAPRIGLDPAVWWIHGYVVVFTVAVACVDFSACVFRAIGTEHWLNDKLRVPLVGEAIGASLFLYLAFAQALTALTVWFFVIAYLLVWINLAVFQPVIKRRVKRRSRTWSFNRLPVGERTVVEVVRDARNYPVLNVFAPLLKVRVGLSVYAIVLSNVMAGIVSMNVGAALSEKPPAQKHGRPAEKTSTRGRGHEHVRTVTFPKVSRSKPIPPEQLMWQDVCGLAAPLPGYDAPAWARDALYDLYLGPGAPGATGAGCTGRTHYPLGRDAGFVYVVGTLDGNVMSVAVVSRDPQRFGAALFLAPAAKIALRLIARHGAIGGSARIEVGAGDLYLVQTAVGTYALVRDQTVLDREPRLAEPYVVTPPAVTDQWYAYMVAIDGWLWPVRVDDDPLTGRQRFDLVRGIVDARVFATVEYDPTTRRAYVDAGGRKVPYHWDGNFVRSDEILPLLNR